MRGACIFHLFTLVVCGAALNSYHNLSKMKEYQWLCQIKILGFKSLALK